MVREALTPDFFQNVSRGPFFLIFFFFRKQESWGGEGLAIFLRMLLKICIANTAEYQQGTQNFDTLLELFVLIKFLSLELAASSP